MLTVFIIFMVIAMLFALATLAYVVMDLAHEKAMHKKEKEESAEKEEPAEPEQ